MNKNEKLPIFKFETSFATDEGKAVVGSVIALLVAVVLYISGVIFVIPMLTFVAFVIALVALLAIFYIGNNNKAAKRNAEQQTNDFAKDLERTLYGYDISLSKEEMAAYISDFEQMVKNGEEAAKATVIADVLKNAMPKKQGENEDTRKDD